ncbi:5-methylcytosine-specific restriction endonuclease system specificity protein McrC [Zhengella mangrovi]|uniref:5-methylcytosine-specific restriction endonuclease system specificity protein McrC n=1 Tax=Zhengella mangrovi TaxID=1982044 RepID=A0A2G1QNF5_9HYPH|nr:5-methylcytosine-specific restriction endonuclease system specificity protein McrC [Zhengella mangrovi]PHP66738.1 5-methylcytosine-specific restriction endonuclease system specificity protein McrC [Zhengella mangrovi]
MGGPIPIRNIYYLLCYSWNRLEEGEIADVSGVDSSELADLFASVLISGVRHLMRRGLGRDYERFEEDLASLRGRVLVAESSRRMLMVHGKARCEYDELTANTIPNRVIKATLRHLAAVPSLDKHLKTQLLGLCRDLRDVEPIPLTRLAFRSIQLHSNARFYRFLINICELVVSSWLVDEATGEYRFRDFLRDEKHMARLFESFVQNFLRHERPELDVRKENIQWTLEWAADDSLDYLPQMETDISVRSTNSTLVIDTKYYGEAFTTFFGKERVRSGHLYQVFTYLKNLEARDGPDSEASALLLYPATSNELRLDYKLGGHRISVCTLDLAQDWKTIRAELLNLVDARL